MVNCVGLMNNKSPVPAFILTICIAFLSYYMSTFNPSFDALVVSIIAGMLLGNTVTLREAVGEGVGAAARVFLSLGIALYGSQLVFSGLRPSVLAGIIAVFAGLFCLTLLISRIFNLNQNLSILLASGLSVCGATAIAVISPLIGARREDTSISIISVMMLGLTGMIFYPMLADIVGLERGDFNFLAGTTLPMLGQVRVAAGAVCPECVATAMQIKLVRISFLFFLVTVAVFLSGREGRKVNVPWFVAVFVVMTLLANFTRVLAPLTTYLKTASAFCLSAGLAAIGLSVDFDTVIEEGLTPLGVISFSWVVVILLMYLVKNLL